MSARILAVEDTPSLRDLLQLCLTRAGYAVDLAEDGGAAVDMFGVGTYDAVVMDIQMPVMNGLEAVSRMREAEKAGARATVPILALTANTEPADLRKCLAAGFTATLRKPFAREDLLAAVSTALGSKTPASKERILVTADPEFADLIPTFLANCRREADAMAKALERRDFAAIAAASHKITGAGASYGFQLLSDKGRLIEAAAKASDRAAVSGHLDAISLYLDRVSVVYS